MSGLWSASTIGVFDKIVSATQDSSTTILGDATTIVGVASADSSQSFAALAEAQTAASIDMQMYAKINSILSNEFGHNRGKLFQ